MRKGKVALGALVGLATGVLAGILFAPEKGSQTRKQIADKADDYVNELKVKYERLRNSLTKKFESTKKDAERLADKGKANYEEAKKEVENAAVDFKHDNLSNTNR